MLICKYRDYVWIRVILTSTLAEALCKYSSSLYIIIIIIIIIAISENNKFISKWMNQARKKEQKKRAKINKCYNVKDYGQQCGQHSDYAGLHPSDLGLSADPMFVEWQTIRSDRRFSHIVSCDTIRIRISERLDVRTRVTGVGRYLAAYDTKES